MTREEALRLALQANPNDPAKAIAAARAMLAFLAEDAHAAPTPTAPAPMPPSAPEPQGANLSAQDRVLLGLDRRRLFWDHAQERALAEFLTTNKETALDDAAVFLGRSVKSCYCRAQKIRDTPDERRALLSMYRFARNKFMAETGQHGTL